MAVSREAHRLPASLPLPKASNINTSVVVYDDVPPPDYIPAGATIEPRPKLNRAGWTLLATGAVSVGLLFWLLLRWWQLTRRVRSATPAEAFPKLLDVLPTSLVAADVRRLERFSLKFRQAFLPAAPVRFIARIFRGNLSTRWSRSPDPARWGTLNRAVPEAGAPSVRVRIVDAPMSPAVCGLFRPVVLLPRMLAENLSARTTARRAAARADPSPARGYLGELRAGVAANCLLVASAVWLANARIRRVREEAVDDAVMLALAAEAETYAPTLLEVARLAFDRPLMSLGLVGHHGIPERPAAAHRTAAGFPRRRAKPG